MRGVAADIQLPPTFASSIRQRIERGGEKIWRLEDFRDLPFSAAAQTLSRLTRQGLLERLSKGTYYRSRETMFGKSRPNSSALRQLASRHAPIFPAGIAAANLLGFSTQTAGQPYAATGGMGASVRSRCRAARLSAQHRKAQRVDTGKNDQQNARAYVRGRSL